MNPKDVFHNTVYSASSTTLHSRSVPLKIKIHIKMLDSKFFIQTWKFRIFETRKCLNLFQFFKCMCLISRCFMLFKLDKAFRAVCANLLFQSGKFPLCIHYKTKTKHKFADFIKNKFVTSKILKNRILLETNFKKFDHP